MTWQCFSPHWSPVDGELAFADDAVAVHWASSGGQWLTHPEAAVPTRLVRELVAVARFLDDRGVGLGDLVGAGGVGVLGERAALLGIGPAGARSAGGASRLIEAEDGWLVVSLPRQEDIDSVPAWLGIEAAPDELWNSVERGLRHRRVADVVDRALLLGMPVAAVGEVTTRNAVLVQSIPGAASRRSKDPLVVSLASLWAGPLAADLLARAGARVISVESSERPDGTRATPTFFDALHGRSLSVALPFTSDEGRRRLRALLERADVVIEGSRPRALAQLGIDADALTSFGPKVWLSITGYGRSDGASQRVGFGDDAAAAGGLVAWVDHRPVFVADAVADPLTGMIAAATVLQLLEAGGRWMVDASLTRCAASVATRPGDEVVPVVRLARPPAPRSDPGAPLPLGRDTDATLRALGIA